MTGPYLTAKLGDKMTAKELEVFLNQQIPLSQALGLRVLSVDHEQVVIECPLSPNINHMGTAFGGSLAAISILAGYAWIYHAVLTRGHNVHIILKQLEIDYLHPVEGAIRAKCVAPDKAKFEAFLKAFEKKGLARLRLVSQVETEGGVACQLNGEFVARA